MNPEITFPRPGMATFRNRFGMQVLYLHYSADPEKGKDWAERERAGMTNPALYEQEYEINFAATQEAGSAFIFSGTVSAQTAAGLTVSFGGIPSLAGQTATVAANGTWRYARAYTTLSGYGGSFQRAWPKRAAGHAQGWRGVAGPRRADTVTA